MKNNSQKLDYSAKSKNEQISLAIEPKILTAVDTKHQQIIYYKWDRNEAVCSKDNTPIDLQKAISEIRGLDWTYSQNHLGFRNILTNETVQFVRLEQDKWYLESLIRPGVKWEGYAWVSEANTESVVELVKLFFEEMPWLYVVDWKLEKHV